MVEIDKSNPRNDLLLSKPEWTNLKKYVKTKKFLKEILWFKDMTPMKKMVSSKNNSHLKTKTNQADISVI